MSSGAVAALTSMLADDGRNLQIQALSVLNKFTESRASVCELTIVRVSIDPAHHVCMRVCVGGGGGAESLKVGTELPALLVERMSHSKWPMISAAAAEMLAGIVDQGGFSDFAVRSRAALP